MALKKKKKAARRARRGYNRFSAVEQQAALDWLQSEVDAGRKPEPTQCMACGQTSGVIEYHTEDYRPPFNKAGEFQLCYPCHRMVHLRYEFPQAWHVYRRRVRSGRALATPFLTSSAADFHRRLIENPHKQSWTMTGKQPRKVLEEMDRRKHDRGALNVE